MRRLALALALLLGLMTTFAAAAEGSWQAVECPQQGFATACEAGLRWRWDDANGLVIHTGQGGGAPCLMIRVTQGAGRDFAGYFDGVLTPRVRELLGERLLAVSPLDTYALGDAALPGVMYTFLDGEGRRQVLFRLFDTRWAANVCYTLRYEEGDADDTLRALGVAVAHFAPEDDMAGATPTEDVTLRDAPCAIECPWQRFTAVCDAPCATHWDARDGLYVYLGQWGRPPYVLVRLAPEMRDIPAFFRDAVTPAMAERYGDGLLDVIDCGNITIGSRVMTGFGYRYRSGGDGVYMLRVLENRDGYSLSCIMKYPDGDEAARALGMSALASIADSLARKQGE